MGRILSAFLMLGISSMCGAQIYKYLGIEDGLSNRRIYRIQKDGRGYMWFLTQEGMDRYDGKRIRHYTVLDGNLKVAPQVNLNWLYTDTENTLWVVGRKGRIFHYDTLHDRFRMVYRIPGLQDDFATGMLCYAYMDRGDRIWLCQGDHIIRYDTRTGIAQRLVSRLRGDITAISETDGTNLFIGTVNGLFPVRERDGVLEALADTDSIRTPVSELYYHPGSKKLFVGTFRKGILVYGVSAGSTLRNVAVNRITPLNDRELLIATGGRGVYRMDVDSLVPKPYITADYASHNGMNGDNINDIYVDGGDRIWLANYPAGVTIRNNRYQSYEWFRHSPGNSRSLVNEPGARCHRRQRRRLVVRHQQRDQPAAACGRTVALLSQPVRWDTGWREPYLPDALRGLAGCHLRRRVRFGPVQDRKENREGGILSPLLCSRGASRPVYQ